MLDAPVNLIAGFLVVALLYLGSFIFVSRFAVDSMPRLYVPMRYVLESEMAPPLRSFLEELNIDVDLAHCMLY